MTAILMDFGFFSLLGAPAHGVYSLIIYNSSANPILDNRYLRGSLAWKNGVVIIIDGEMLHLQHFYNIFTINHK